MSDRYNRKPLTSAEFRDRIDRLREMFPGSVITSSHRTASHNNAVGGGQGSKHLLYPLTPVACDLAWPGLEIANGDAMALSIQEAWRTLGGFGLYHKGHLHAQALPVGPVPEGYEP